jgi:hypothetical protein
MASNEWFDSLRDPRWQQVRLRVMERDGWECLRCGDKGNTLNVHHNYYEKGRQPWEYPHDTLSTLCQDCHAAYHRTLSKVKRRLGRLNEQGLCVVARFIDDILTEDARKFSEYIHMGEITDEEEEDYA